MMLPAPVEEFALRYVFLDARILIDPFHHPLLHQWVGMPGLSLIDGLPGLAEEGLRLRAGCPGRFSSSEQALPDAVSPVRLQWRKRLRMRLSHVAYPYLCHWLSEPVDPVARAIELPCLMEQGLQVRRGRFLATPFKTPSSLPLSPSVPEMSLAVPVIPETQAEQPLPVGMDLEQAPPAPAHPKPKKFNLPLLSALTSQLDSATSG